MSSLYCKPEIRRTVRCGEARVESYLDLALNERGVIVGRSVFLFTFFFLFFSPDDSCPPLSVTGLSPCVMLWWEPALEQLVKVLEKKLPRWVIMSSWSVTPQSAQLLLYNAGHNHAPPAHCYRLVFMFTLLIEHDGTYLSKGRSWNTYDVRNVGHRVKNSNNPVLLGLGTVI